MSEPDDGIYDAMNKGLDLATGDIICFLNADDYYAFNSVLSKVVMHMNTYHLDALVADVGFFKPKKPNKIYRHFRSNRFSPERLAWGWMPAHPGLFLRREVAERVGHLKRNIELPVTTNTLFARSTTKILNTNIYLRSL